VGAVQWVRGCKAQREPGQIAKHIGGQAEAAQHQRNSPKRTVVDEGIARLRRGRRQQALQQLLVRLELLLLITGVGDPLQLRVDVRHSACRSLASPGRFAAAASPLALSGVSLVSGLSQSLSTAVACFLQ